jgi:PAS domain S-box-containing protein
MASTPSNLKRQIGATSSAAHSTSRVIGAGEMAELIRGFEWASGPLGPVESWSDTLVTTVNLLLASRHPMFLWWGPDLIQFYNDGYRPSIRADKHPGAVGQRGKECWPEIWHIIGPQIEAVMNRGESSWNLNQLVPINRDGKLEEVYWTYSYSPVRDVDGSVQGTLVVCSETTEHVLSERRLQSLLSITADNFASGQTIAQLAASQPLLRFAKRIVKTLDENPADIPFAGLYLFANGEIVRGERAASEADALTYAARWPLERAMQSRSGVVVEDLQTRFGDVVRKPWPEPIRRGYVLPIFMPALSIQAVLVLGISPRLPFDDNYRTFFELVGARVAALLQSEVHQLELAEAARRFSSLVGENPFGMMIGGIGGDLKYVSPAFLETLGYTDAEVSSGQMRWDRLTPPEYANADLRALGQLRATGRCDVYEKAFMTKDGHTVPVLIGASILEKPILENSGVDRASDNLEIAAFVTDLTPLKAAQEALREAYDELEKKVVERTAALEGEVAERKRAEMSLRELSGRLLVTQDAERRHIARELHDHAGQTLAVLAMNLSALRKVASDLGNDEAGRIAQLAAESHQLSDALSREIRTFSYLLHPPLLDEIGLRSAIPWYVEGFAERSKIKVDLNLSKDLGRLPKDLELVIFRVVQEALTNIHRHSGSSTASIQLISSESSVELEVRDAGKGISPERQRQLHTAKSGVGVRGMEERVRQFGGTLKISSSEQGTKVAVHLPLKSSGIDA